MVVINTSSGVPKKYIDEGDAKNKSLIDAEAKNRASADTTLQTNISNEATARTNADTALGKRIDDVVADVNGLGTAATKNVGTASGEIPVLNSKGQLPDSVIPPLAIGQPVGTVNTVNDLKTLTTAQTGDFAFVTGESDKSKNGTYILAGTAYNSADAWKKIATPDLVWGNITGTLANQTDLQTALNGKLDKTAYFGPSSAGTTVQTYYGGGKGWQNLVGTGSDYNEVRGLYPSSGDIAPSADAVIDTVECAMATSIVPGVAYCTTEPTDSTDADWAPEGYGYRLVSGPASGGARFGPWIGRYHADMAPLVTAIVGPTPAELDWWSNAEIFITEVPNETDMTVEIRAYSKIPFDEANSAKGVYCPVSVVLLKGRNIHMMFKGPEALAFNDSVNV